MRHIKFILTAALVCGFSLLSFTAQPTFAVDELVVTATRTPQAKLTHLGNVATINPADSVAEIFPSEILNKAAGVQIHRGSGQEHLTAIRSPVLVGGAGAGSFLYLEDGIAMRAAGFANVNALLDAFGELSERVELVRGPGSALYGSNAVHGLINFIGGEIEDGNSVNISGGSYGRYQFIGKHAAKGANAARRIGVVLAGEEEGYRANAYFAQQKVKFEGAWHNAKSNYHLSLAGVNLNQETAGYATAYDDLGNPSGAGSLPLGCQVAGGGRAYEIKDCAKSNPNPEAYRDARAMRGYLRTTHRLDNGATLTITPYMRNNNMQFFMHFLPTQPIEKNGHTSFGAQTSYAASLGSLDYIIGFDIERTDGKLSEVQSAASRFGYEQGTHYDYEIGALTLAPYIHSVWAFSDTIDLTGGLRVEHTRYDYSNKTDSGTQGRLFRPASRHDNYTDISPKLGVLFHLAKNRKAFINYARAARAPQTSDLYRLRDSDRDGANTPDPSALKSETLDSIELGYRASHARLNYEINLFAMQKRNYHFRDADDNYVANGKTKHYGIEAEANAQLTDTLAIAATASHAIHKYDFDRPLNTNSNASEAISRGNDIDSAPRWQAGANILWALHPRLNTKIEWQYLGSYYMDAANSTKYKGHQLLDWQMEFFATPQTTLKVKIENLADTAYATRADRWFGNNRYFIGEGRRWTLSYSHKF